METMKIDDILKLNTVELKSIAYDTINQLEQLKKGLDFINNELASRSVAQANKKAQTNKVMEEEKVETPVEEVVAEETPTETVENTEEVA